MYVENISLFLLSDATYDADRRLNTIHIRSALTKPIDTKQQLSALAAAVGITFSIVWALSSYAYSAIPSAEASPTAARIAQMRACS
jgi:hypothetical protein